MVEVAARRQTKMKRDENRNIKRERNKTWRIQLAASQGRIIQYSKSRPAHIIQQKTIPLSQSCTASN